MKQYKQLSFDGGWKELVGVDGARIYMVLFTPEYTGMAELYTAGGDLRRVPLLPTRTAMPMQISADGTELLVIDPWPVDRQPVPLIEAQEWCDDTKKAANGELKVAVSFFLGNVPVEDMKSVLTACPNGLDVSSGAPARSSLQ